MSKGLLSLLDEDRDIGAGAKERDDKGIQCKLEAHHIVPGDKQRVLVHQLTALVPSQAGVVLNTLFLDNQPYILIPAVALESLLRISEGASVKPAGCPELAPHWDPHRRGTAYRQGEPHPTSASTLEAASPLQAA